MPGGFVLAGPDFDGLYLLNLSAAFIWRHRRLGLSPDQISVRLAGTFQLPEEIARRDVSVALDQWSEAFPHTSSGPGQCPPPEFAQTAHPVASTVYGWKGKQFRVVLASPELDAEITPRLLELRAPHSEPDFTFRLTTSEDLIYLHCDEEFISAEVNVSAARAILLQEIVRRTHTLPTPRHWLSLLHAGACGNDSACVVFPAASHSGKTTLAAVLMQSGLNFYADDSVALDKETLQIPAMPFALAVREGSWPLLASRFPGFSQLPVTERFGQQVRFIYPSVHPTSAAAAALVFTRYAPGGALSIEPLDTLQALVHLTESGFWVERQRESIRAFLAWLESLPCFYVTYGDVDAAAEFISSLLPR